MHTIDFRQKIENKIQAAFVVFYALDGQPWLHYRDGDGQKTARTELTVPTCLMNNRCDGQLGFIGGKVEEGESLEEAALREVREEIGHTAQGELEPIVAHDIGQITTHAFALRLTYTELRDIQKDAVQADHFGSEVTGLLLPHLIDYDQVLGKGRGIAYFLQNSMAPSVREELVHFLLKKEVFSRSDLEIIAGKAGLDLAELLS